MPPFEADRQAWPLAVQDLCELRPSGSSTDAVPSSCRSSCTSSTGYSKLADPAVRFEGLLHAALPFERAKSWQVGRQYRSQPRCHVSPVQMQAAGTKFCTSMAAWADECHLHLRTAIATALYKYQIICLAEALSCTIALAAAEAITAPINDSPAECGVDRLYDLRQNHRSSLQTA